MVPLVVSRAEQTPPAQLQNIDRKSGRRVLVTRGADVGPPYLVEKGSSVNGRSEEQRERCS